MIKRSWLGLVSCAAVFALLGVPLIVTAPPRAQEVRSLGTESGFGIFQQRCMGCHGNPEYSDRASSPSALRELSPEAIYESLTTGAMKVEGGKLSDEEPRSGIFWGGAADDQHAYFGLSGGGATAIRLADGARRWSVPLDATRARISHAAAATAMPGVVFVAGSDGKLHALSAADGRELWMFETAREFPTINNVAARGGSIRAPGVTVAGGMVFVASGYGVFPNDLPGNVVLAFSPANRYQRVGLANARVSSCAFLR